MYKDWHCLGPTVSIAWLPFSAQPYRTKAEKGTAIQSGVVQDNFKIFYAVYKVPPM